MPIPARTSNTSNEPGTRRPAFTRDVLFRPLRRARLLSFRFQKFLQSGAPRPDLSFLKCMPRLVPVSCRHFHLGSLSTLSERSPSVLQFAILTFWSVD